MPRPDRSFRTPAIILKRRDFGEADRLLTVVTPHHGKLDVIAKGARKPTSSKTGHVELFTRADMLIHTGRTFGIVVQAEMQEPFLVIREDLHRGAYASYIAELLDRFTVGASASSIDSDMGLGGEEQELAVLYTLFDETLARLCNDDDPRLAVRYFEMRLLDQVGFRPEVLECVIGREPLLPVDQYFSFADGGVICPADVGRVKEGHALVPISMMTLKLLRHMQRSPYKNVKTLKNIDIRVHDNTERVLLGYITYLLERRLQSVDFIQRLRRQISRQGEKPF